MDGSRRCMARNMKFLRKIQADPSGPATQDETWAGWMGRQHRRHQAQWPHAAWTADQASPTPDQATQAMTPKAVTLTPPQAVSVTVLS